MSTLEQALARLSQTEYAVANPSFLPGIDARAKVIVTLLYLIALLTLPLASPDRLILFALYPMAASLLSGADYCRVFLWSLVVVPFAAMIAMFNPMLDHSVAFYLGPYPVTFGWASFFTILFRAVLATQAVLVLILSTGFHHICFSLQQLGVGAMFSSLLLFIHRYIRVLIQEAVCMDRARRSRGFGRRHYPLKMWGRLVGQLLMRSVDRAERVQMAMDARGFAGRICCLHRSKWNLRSSIYLAAWTAFFLLIWFMAPGRLFNFFQ